MYYFPYVWRSSAILEQCPDLGSSGPDFPAFGLNTEIQRVRIQVFVLSPNTQKYGPDTHPKRKIFKQ